MSFSDKLRQLEEKYDINQCEHARELGRLVADLQD